MLKLCIVLVLGVALALASVTSVNSTELRITSKALSRCPDTRDSVAITVSGLVTPISSFKMALGLREADYSFLDVHPGTFMSSCQWEYLTWKVDRKTPITNGHQKGDIAGSDITAILEISGFGSVFPEHTPTCQDGAGELELAGVVFLVAHSVGGNPTLCRFLPLRFYWRDCRDNTLVSQRGDTVFSVTTVSDAWSPGVINPPEYTFPGLGAPGFVCDTVVTRHDVASLSAINGGFDVPCADSLDLCNRGDLNLNGYPAEIADVVLFQNFFIYGLPVFCFPSPRLEQAIAQSDMNRDGITLTVADLVYLMRIIIEDIQL